MLASATAKEEVVVPVGARGERHAAKYIDIIQHWFFVFCHYVLFSASLVTSAVFSMKLLKHCRGITHEVINFSVPIAALADADAHAGDCLKKTTGSRGLAELMGCLPIWAVSPSLAHPCPRHLGPRG